ncbi:MAG: hypothetical protein AABX16_02445 [Nanoarchaeota archaeon]
MRKLNIKINIPENVNELERLEQKIVGIIPKSLCSNPIPNVYFGSHNGNYEFLEQDVNICFREFLFSNDIHADVIPEDALNFTKNGIYFIRRNFPKIYYPQDEGYQPRLTSLKANKLWLAPRKLVTA